MTAKVFVDSNILIYAHDLDAGVKNQRANVCLIQLWSDRNGRHAGKVQHPLSAAAARAVVRNYESLITPDTIVRASEIGAIISG